MPEADTEEWPAKQKCLKVKCRNDKSDNKGDAYKGDRKAVKVNHIEEGGDDKYSFLLRSHATRDSGIVMLKSLEFLSKLLLIKDY